MLKHLTDDHGVRKDSNACGEFKATIQQLDIAFIAESTALLSQALPLPAPLPDLDTADRLQCVDCGRLFYSMYTALNHTGRVHSIEIIQWDARLSPVCVQFLCRPNFFFFFFFFFCPQVDEREPDVADEPEPEEDKGQQHDPIVIEQTRQGLEDDQNDVLTPGST